MNTLQEILKSQDGKVVAQIAKQFGLNSQDVVKALSNLFPAVAGGIKKTAQSRSGLESLIKKIESDKTVNKSIDIPEVLEKEQATRTGNEILGDIFGSKEISRTITDQTAKSIGVDLGILKKMLPLLAGLVFSSLNKHSRQNGGSLLDILGGLGGERPQPQQRGGGLLSAILGKGRTQQNPNLNADRGAGLESLLDFDGDGNIADDVMDLAKQLF